MKSDGFPTKRAERSDLMSYVSGRTSSESNIPTLKWESCAKELRIMNFFIEEIGGSRRSFKNPNTQRRMKFADELTPCYEKWLACRGERKAFERSEYVLRMYYQKDKILDYLLRLDEFVNGINPTDDQEIVALKGYNNYIFFLGSFTKKLKTEWEALSEYESASDAPVSVTDLVCAFLLEECQDIGLISMIPGILGGFEQYAEKYQPEDKIISSDISSVRKLMLECSEWKTSLDGKSLEQAKENLSLLEGSLEERSQRYSSDIENGSSLYATLCELITPEWTEKFDPDVDNSPLSGMNSIEIKEFYQREMTEIREKLLATYKRS
ncbi:MAG: hypothetical protein LUG86_09010 [Oscillospiraceae bacterium]|nr:hypothetical protein [Oscillospiraceae bacterium]